MSKKITTIVAALGLSISTLATTVPTFADTYQYTSISELAEIHAKYAADMESCGAYNPSDTTFTRCRDNLATTYYNRYSGKFLALEKLDKTEVRMGVTAFNPMANTVRFYIDETRAFKDYPVIFENLVIFWADNTASPSPYWNNEPAWAFVDALVNSEELPSGYHIIYQGKRGEEGWLPTNVENRVVIDDDSGKEFLKDSTLLSFFIMGYDSNGVRRLEKTNIGDCRGADFSDGSECRMWYGNNSRQAAYEMMKSDPIPEDVPLIEQNKILKRIKAAEAAARAAEIRAEEAEARAREAEEAVWRAEEELRQAESRAAETRAIAEEAAAKAKQAESTASEIIAQAREAIETAKAALDAAEASGEDVAEFTQYIEGIIRNAESAIAEAEQSVRTANETASAAMSLAQVAESAASEAKTQADEANSQASEAEQSALAAVQIAEENRESVLLAQQDSLKAHQTASSAIEAAKSATTQASNLAEEVKAALARTEALLANAATTPATTTIIEKIQAPASAAQDNESNQASTLENQEQTKETPDDYVELPLSGTQNGEEKTAEFPWWLIIFIFSGISLILWWLITANRKSEKS
ncbi:MAG: hypothetical protein Q4B87_01340 [Candidatus Saccharibacteria bacterium]|nr:hypothetical protein [Candidatus Saccharibacteria bacterium]